ncbi:MULTISPECIES: hypothetical protein [unclassified Vibrio]|uniref:hypothetical protein n=1 Tax=unclassified Vibrio TaxID=2614977 RepID=UPI001A8DE4B6|nr:MULTISPECIES: hypothetical protein [unclassified Vibrio]MBO0243241.1 hypothetical protein [Vibrio sp. Vb0592]MDW1732421.1 hypothetical protein [Vibrio sp. Vb2235]MDW1784692.1 hypothetical protein [Vibrio sp. Vb2227]MDW1814324.1 hypothetical protein [Vibrio sp. Vb2232]MDW1864520.1 hypothetical protein [Vibrio sp. Vb1127]
MNEPDLSIHHAEVKIVWANELICTLIKEIDSFMERKPYSISLSPDPEQGMMFILNVELKEGIPYRIPCLIGDICNGLRSSMDTCWMGLQRSLNPDCRRSYFPIREHDTGLVREAEKTLNGQNLIKMTSIFDTLKPHHQFESGGNKHLIELNDLNNWQKHNMLVPAFAVTKLGDNTLITSNDGSSIRLDNALVHGQVAGIGGTAASMTYDSEPTVEVLLKTGKFGGYQPIIPLLEAFRDVAVNCLECFKREFSNSK